MISEKHFELSAIWTIAQVLRAAGNQIKFMAIVIMEHVRSFFFKDCTEFLVKF